MERENGLNDAAFVPDSFAFFFKSLPELTDYLS